MWGQRFISRTHDIDEDQIRVFASQLTLSRSISTTRLRSERYSPVLPRAAGTPQRSPWRLLVETGLPLAGGLIGAGGELTWPRPTRPGDTLQVESEVVDITPSRSRPDRRIAVVRSLTRNQKKRSSAGAHGQIDCSTPGLVNENLTAEAVVNARHTMSRPSRKRDVLKRHHHELDSSLVSFRRESTRHRPIPDEAVAMARRTASLWWV